MVYLVKMLERSNVELLILGTTFLKKLSIYKENKEKMAECRCSTHLQSHDRMIILVCCAGAAAHTATVCVCYRAAVHFNCKQV